MLVRSAGKLTNLDEIKVVHPEDLLCPLSVVDHPALCGHGGLLVEGLGVELGLDDLGNAAVACVRNNGCEIKSVYSIPVDNTWVNYVQIRKCLRIVIYRYINF